jgi:hypothetical protein
MDMTTAWFLATGMVLISSPDTDRTGDCSGTVVADVVLRKCESANIILLEKLTFERG